MNQAQIELHVTEHAAGNRNQSEKNRRQLTAAEAISLPYEKAVIDLSFDDILTAQRLKSSWLPATSPIELGG